MHQNAANGMIANTPLFVPAAVDTIGDASPVRAFSLKRELRRVVKDQHCVLARRKAIMRRLKVPLQDVSLRRPAHWRKSEMQLWCSPSPGKPSVCFHLPQPRSAPAIPGIAYQGEHPQTRTQQRLAAKSKEPAPEKYLTKLMG